MSKTSDQIAKANTALKQIKPDIVEDAVNVVRGNASLLGAIGVAEDLRPGESLDIDFKKGVFAVKNPQGTILSGESQVIGEYGPETKIFTWSFKNKSQVNRAFRDIEEFMRSDRELVSLADFAEFKLEEHEAAELAGWIAWRAGFRGAYAVPEGEHASYVALNLTRLVKHSTKPEENMWCLFCGEDGRDGTMLLQLTEAHAVCEDCIEEASEAVLVQDELDELKGKTDAKLAAAPDESAPLMLSYCVMCERRLPNLIVVNDIACVCRSCIKVGVETLTDAD